MSLTTSILHDTLTSDEFVALRENRFKLHCLDMKLTSLATDEKTFTGSGFIQQSPDGVLQFTLYSKDKISALELFERLNGGRQIRTGSIIPDSYYYRLSIRDTRGREWVCERVEAGIDATNDTGTICTGDLTEIINTAKETQTGDAVLYLEIFDNHIIKLPYNAKTVINRNVAGEESVSMQLNVLQFTVGEILFSIQRGSKSLQVTATSAEQSFDENFDLRVMETFQFMLARPLQWSIMIMQTSNSILTRIRETRPDVLRYQVSPPIALTIDNTEPFCDLFGGYLKHILEYHEGRLHPISANMRSICLASVGVIETKSLAICVAVESIVKLVNPKKYKLSSEEKDWIKKADEYFASWGGPEDLTKRITGLFSMLSQTSAKIRLQGLVDLDVITEDKVQAWSTLRNKLAHGEGRGSKSWQEFLTLSNTVLLLFYHLVFHALKYEGKYTDYSTLGWPLKTYQVISESKNKTTTNA